MNLEENILRELKKQIIAPEKVIKLRIYLYTDKINKEYLWGKIHYKIKSLTKEESIIPYKKWIITRDTLDKYGLKEVEKIYQQKHNIYERWNNATIQGGFYAKKLIEDYLIEKGMKPSRHIVKWNGKRFRIDTWNSEITIKIKNIFSDVFYNPDTITKLNGNHVQVKRFFEYAKYNGITPILIAPLIDNSFYKFAKEHNGLFCRTYIQILKPPQKTLAWKINQVFNIANIMAVNRIPNTIKSWIETNIL